MAKLFCRAGILCALLLIHVGTARAADMVRIAVQKTGTLSWELATIRSHGLDREAGLALEVTELASPEAGRIALRSGNVDILLSDWLWVSRERRAGAKLTFYPYSTALGAVMVAPGSAIHSLGDLQGRSIAVAGGPIDKSWILLQARLRQDGIDLPTAATIAYGAPPLIAAKAEQGEWDASLNFWNFCAQLEARGFRRLIAIEDIISGLGAKGPVAMVGYVFDQDWAARHPSVITRFLAMTAKAREMLATSDGAWEKIAPLIGTSDQAVLRAYRLHYRNGIPRRSVAEQEADARVLYRILAEVGGPALVGPGAELEPGTFFHAGTGE
ncbi:MAG: ABC transporter substrate-binding protein [Alphaproteobacteria bacterium]|nr:ABC transporter substrate-binding protein [Alphaproteobacteria bacterium]